MAQMIPEMFPENGPGRHAEKLVFDSLKSSLSDEFYVYHSVEFINPATAYEGEADFLILHPNLGLLVIECKGKGVFFDNFKSEWVRFENSCKRVIKSPFRQVREQKYDLISIFTARMKNEFPEVLKYFPLPFGHAVATPFALFKESELPVDITKEMIFDAKSLENIEENIVATMNFWGRRHKNYTPFTKSQLNYFRNSVLHPSVNLAPSLGATLEIGRQKFHILSKTQSQFINSLRLNNKILIQGGAGTGKTVLALEAAREMAEQGKKVLLMCYTSALAKHLASKIESMATKNIVASTFHSEIASLAWKMGIKIDEKIKNAVSKNEFWNEESPLILSEAEERGILPKYDAVILDEGQDFHENWWDFIELYQKDPENSKFYIFFDPMQNIYHDKIDLPDFPTKFSLDLNFRNTKLIAHEIEKIARSSTKSAADSPLGVRPVFHEQSSPQKTTEAVKKLISHLIFSEDIKPDNITILSPHSHKNSSLATLDAIGGIPVSLFPNNRDDQILHSTIGKFKGLESDVLILVDIDPKDPLSNKKACYVALSRARQVLHVFHKGKWDFFIK